eukprot:13785256-Ditylum_brightwellii.AAC.1
MDSILEYANAMSKYQMVKVSLLSLSLLKMMEVERMDDELLKFWGKLNSADKGDLDGELVAGDVALDLTDELVA